MTRLRRSLSRCFLAWSFLIRAVDQGVPRPESFVEEEGIESGIEMEAFDCVTGGIMR